MKIAAFCALVTILSCVACGGGNDSPASSTSTPGITVLDGTETVGTYPTTAKAFAKASEVAAFQVLEAHELPPGDTIDAITVLNSPASSRVRQVQVGVRGESGGLLITELNTRFTQGDDATRLTSQQPGEFYAAGTGTTKSWYLLTDDRTYALGSANRVLSDAEAITVLASLR
jgi:hypothetical protein